MNIVLISRTPHKLQDVASELRNIFILLSLTIAHLYYFSEKKYKVETKIIDVDFTNSTIYDRIKSEISNLEIGVLINNVGMSYDHPEFLTELDTK